MVTIDAKSLMHDTLFALHISVPDEVHEKLLNIEGGIFYAPLYIDNNDRASINVQAHPNGQ